MNATRNVLGGLFLLCLMPGLMVLDIVLFWFRWPVEDVFELTGIAANKAMRKFREAIGN